MGLVRGSLVFFFGFLLLLSLIVGNLFLMLNFSLSYSNVSPYIQNATNQIAVNSGSSALLLQNYESQKTLCAGQNSIQLSFQGKSYNISCELASEGAKSVIDNIIANASMEAYYKNYSCSLLNCANESTPFVFFSKYAKSYWNSKFQTMILISLVLFLLIFIFSKEKKNAFIITGVLMILSAIPFREVSLLTNIIPNFFPFKIVPLFFSGAKNVFWIMVMMGAIFIAGGVGLIFVKLGEKAKNFVSPIVKKMKEDEKEVEDEEKPVTREEVEKIVKKEVKEEEKPKKEKKSKKKK